ncbi:type II secretion system minor pseudopilin [Marilutibacter alkalisoli]|uniref:Type II secretion system protein K n=1 Tax=Marilutibacter alkalisoli TaxID=2591633 RepID=A0A514BU95_9GAMM|nr:type II secretion system protein GspK [Lysobacter alkalisoli]QDH70988.1 general secretion pathway protein GspK [Lysobacter alkalisoli]
MAGNDRRLTVAGCRLDTACPRLTTAARPRGAALLLVLWLITLLTALVGAFALTARVEALQGRVLVSGLAAGNAARAGLEYALTRIELDDPRRQWQPDGQPHAWRYAGAEIEVTIIDEGGKVDLNQADMTLLAGLLRVLGSEQFEAEQLAGAVLDWRDADSLTQPTGGAEDADYAAAGRPYGAKDGEFESIAELQQVLGFTSEIYARIAPHVTVYSGRPRPDTAFASQEVLDAMGLDGELLVTQRRQLDPVTGEPMPGAVDNSWLVGSRSGTYSIGSRARLADGREGVVRAVVRTGGGAMPGMAYTVLRWEEGVTPR